MNSIREETYSRLRSFKYAFEGLWYVIRTQHNAWIHAVFTVAVLVLGFWLRVTPFEWALLVLCMMAVWMGEFLNTAVEAVVDMVSPEFHPLAKTAKDVAAAAVLLGAIGSAIVGLIIFGPRLMTLFFG